MPAPFVIKPGDAPRPLTLVGEQITILAWGAHDCFFVPSWNWHSFENKSAKEPAIVFSVTDRPVLESLGLFREEAA